MTSSSPAPPRSFGQFQFSPWFRKTGFTLVKIFVVCHLFVFGYFVWRQFQRDDYQRDMSVYYRAVQRVAKGESPYTPRPLYGPHQTPFDYLYPPPFVALISPSAPLSWPVWSKFWLALVCVGWWCYAACLVGLSGFPLRPLNLGIAGAILMIATPNFGSYRAISMGQADVFLWLAFALALINLESQRKNSRVLAGWLLGSSALVKIYSLWTFFALRERQSQWETPIGALLALGLGAALGAWVCGVSAYSNWAHRVLPVVGQGTFNTDNVSFSMGVLRLVHALGWNYTNGPLPGLARVWLSVAACLGPLLALWFSRRLRGTQRVALVGIVAAWCAPICWTFYLPLAFAPLALWWKDKLSQQ